jgi:acyl phosphate:glycerol-3-phosphate acyltransferase
MTFTPIVAVVAAYLIGSLSFAVLVSKALGLPDPHSYGSGNPGATNVLRTGSKKAAVLTLIGDAGKGWVAVTVAIALSPRFGLGPVTIALVALAAFLGHLFPLYFRFRGGKGVATAAGILLALNVWLGVATLLTWVVIALIFRYSSFAALVAAVFAPLYSFLLFGARPVTAAALGISVLLIWRHRRNIARLLAGTESRIGDQDKDPAGCAGPPQTGWSGQRGVTTKE